MSGSGFLRDAPWRAGFLLARVVNAVVYRVRVEGDVPPTRGPVLFVGNHGAVLDPFWVAAAAGRPVRFMANERLFRGRISGPLVRLFGAVPKRKFEPDVAAVRQFVRLCRQGHAVGIFPEGRRTWDGRALPLVPGTGRLVKLLGVPVVFVRNHTSYLRSPQWARHTRWVPIRLSVSGPVQFRAEDSEEQIEREIARRIAVDPLSTPAPRFSFGWRMAEGLPDLLWACPRCFAVDALHAAGPLRNDLRCRQCQAAWRLRVDHRLEARSAATPSLHVAQACDRIHAHFGDRPVILSQPAQSGEVVLAEPEARVSVRGERGLELAGEGRLELTENELRLRDGGGKALWVQPVAGIHAAFVQEAHVLVRGGERLAYLDVGRARNKWLHFVARYARAVHGKEL